MACAAVVRLDDVAAMAFELPEVTEGARHGNHTWCVNGKGFAWERLVHEGRHQAVRRRDAPGRRDGGGARRGPAREGQTALAP
jgi:hypothetical protein